MTGPLCMVRDTSVQEFQGLKRMVTMIAKHPNYAGKQEAIEECVEDIVERSRRGRLTPVQRGELLGILLGSDGDPA